MTRSRVNQRPIEVMHGALVETNALDLTILFPNGGDDVSHSNCIAVTLATPDLLARRESATPHRSMPVLPHEGPIQHEGLDVRLIKVRELNWQGCGSGIWDNSLFRLIFQRRLTITAAACNTCFWMASSEVLPASAILTNEGLVGMFSLLRN